MSQLVMRCAEARPSPVFTVNASAPAPVILAKHLAKGAVRYLLINAGNANAGPANRTCKRRAKTYLPPALWPCRCG